MNFMGNSMVGDDKDKKKFKIIRNINETQKKKIMNQKLK